MFRTQQQTVGMSMAAMPLLRMQSQTTTLDSLNRISRPPSGEIVEVAAENRNEISSALEVILQIASQLPSSYQSLASWTLQKPSCEIVEITRGGTDSSAQPTKSRWRQIAKQIMAFIATIPPIIFIMHLIREECRKVKEVQDQCIAIEQNAIFQDAWSRIWYHCESAAGTIRHLQALDKPDKQLKCEEAIIHHLQICKGILISARELCEIVEKKHRLEYFRPTVNSILKILQEHYHPT